MIPTCFQSGITTTFEYSCATICTEPLLLPDTPVLKYANNLVSVKMPPYYQVSWYFYFQDVLIFQTAWIYESEALDYFNSSSVGGGIKVDGEMKAFLQNLDDIYLNKKDSITVRCVFNKDDNLSPFSNKFVFAI